MKIGIFNAFAPLVHLGALESVAAELDLELLEIVAEPYAVARVVGARAGAPGRRALRRHRRRHDRRRPRPLGRDRGDPDVRPWRAGLHEVAGRPPRPALPAGRGAQGRLCPRPRRSSEREEVAEIVADDVAVWAAGMELVLDELGGGDMLPSRIYLCGGGSRLPETAAALRGRVVLEAAARSAGRPR